MRLTVSPVVVGVDGSPESIEALAAAAELAAMSGRGLVVVHVRHANPLSGSAAVVEPSAGWAIDDALDQREAFSCEQAKAVMREHQVDWRFETAEGDPARELIAAAEQWGADGIVVGGHRHGVVGGLVAGSVAQKLIRHSPVSVYVVRDGHPHELPAGADA